jgi:hypothetical protein
MIFHLPTHITKGKRVIKSIPINLNKYRNWHPAESNEIKRLYKLLLTDQLSKCPKLPEPCMVAYYYYPGSRRKTDLDNVIAVTNKFFLDALVEAGKLSSDDCSVVSCFTAQYVEVDKENPRIEAHIAPRHMFNLLRG